MGIAGVDDIVVMATEQVAYLKLDKQKLTDISRQQLSRMTLTQLDI
jgi:hypothetical protein